MSRKEALTLNCPECGEPQQTVVWHSLNVTLDPEAKQELFEGRLNVLSCGGCGSTFKLDSPLLYHDMERGFAIQYYPPDALDEPAFYEQFGAEGQLDIPDLAGLEVSDVLRRPHVVFDLQELARYVTFREQLHERRTAKGDCN
jgi:hypothetical protein